MEMKIIKNRQIYFFLKKFLSFKDFTIFIKDLK